MKTNNKRHANSAIIIIVGILILMLALVLTTVWMGQSANKNTKDAVRSVSLLYLGELADRREQVVAKNLEDRILDMQAALDLMTEEDLQDEAHRQEYQKKMKTLFILEKFAFVDTEGLILTSEGVQSNINEYHFDYLNLTDAEISLQDEENNEKTLLLRCRLI